MYQIMQLFVEKEGSGNEQYICVVSQAHQSISHNPCVWVLISCVTSQFSDTPRSTTKRRDALAKSQNLTHTDSGICNFIVELNVFKIPI